MPIFLKPFQNIEEEALLPNTFYEANKNLIPTHGKENKQTNKQLQTNIFNKYRCKNAKQNISKNTRSYKNAL